MPISLDFPEITDAFRKFLLLPARQIAHLFESVSRWLAKRVMAADMLEQASRALPIVDFEGDAVAGWLDPMQARGLAPEATAPGLAERLKAGGRRFLDGVWGNLKTLVEQELILPRLFIVLADAVAAIETSVQRFTQQNDKTPDLLFGHAGFGAKESARRSAGDLWGEAALAYRAIAASLDQFAAFKTSLERAKAIVNAPVPGETTPESAPTRADSAGAAISAPETSLADSLENYGRYLLAGVLALPALPAFAASFWNAVSVRIKAATLEKLAGCEASLNRLRQRAIAFFFTDLYLMVHKAASYCFAAQKALSANLRFFGEAALAYGELIADALRTWLKDIGDLLNKYIGYLNFIFSVFRFLLDFDVGHVIVVSLSAAFGPAAAATLVATMPPLTVGDLLEMGVDGARNSARAALWTCVKAIQLYVGAHPLTSDSFLSERFDALPGIVSKGLKKYPGLGKGPAVNWPGSAAFPDLFGTFFAPGLGAFRDSVNALGATTAQSLRDMPGVASVALKISADEFDAAAEGAGQALVSRGMGAIAAAADRQSGAAFGADLEQLSKKIAAAKPDPVAENFERWLAFGGFALLTDAIPAYFAAARDFWRERQKRGEEAAVRIDKTSPHILARRAMLARAVVGKIRVDATGRPVDRSLAEAIAERFRAAAQQAYLAANLRLELYGIEEA